MAKAQTVQFRHHTAAAKEAEKIGGGECAEIFPPGRKAVRVYFIELLEAEGLRRHKNETLAAHDEFLDRVKDRLSYMRPDTLLKLVPIARSLAQGPARDRWPTLASITNFAHQLQAPPDRSDEILWSWFHSRAGVAAREAGTMMATHHLIKSTRRPPITAKGGSFEMKRIAENQMAIDRDIELARRDRANGQATQSQIEWLRDQDECQARLDAIVDAGIAHRRALASEAEAAA